MAERTSTFASIMRAAQAAPVIKERLWLILAFTAGGTAVQVLVPVIVQQTVDRFVSARGEVDLAGVSAGVAIGLGVIAAGAFMSRTGLVQVVRNSTAGLSVLRVSTFLHLVRRSVLHVESERRGALVARVTSDVSAVQEFMDWGGVMLLVNLAQATVTLAVMGVYEWRLALLVMAGVVLYGLLLVFSQRILRARYDAVRLVVADSLAVTGEAVSALAEVRAFGAEAATMHRVRDSLQARFDVEFRTFRLGHVLFATSEIFAASLTVVVLAAGLWLGPARGITAGVLLAFLFLVTLLVEPVQNLVEILEAAQSAAAGLRRITTALDAPIEIPEPVEPETLPAGALGVSFEKVRYSYPGGPDALSDLTVDVAAGRRVAVVGQTGSGKTTFAKLLVRLLDPSAGVVSIGGCDVRHVASRQLRSRVGFVPQEGFLFSGTVGDNIRYGKTDASDREVRTAFIELGLDRWLDGLPANLDTQVGPRGGNLSAGERQLVALVRAWISTPDLLVMDEATSAVDPALDVQLRRAIERLTAGRTSVTIAHRLATAEAADEILVFDEGRLVERGPHRDLLAPGGVYSALYRDWSAGTAAM